MHYILLQKHHHVSLAGRKVNETPARPVAINSQTQRLVGREGPVAALDADLRYQRVGRRLEAIGLMSQAYHGLRAGHVGVEVMKDATVYKMS